MNLDNVDFSAISGELGLEEDELKSAFLDSRIFKQTGEDPELKWVYIY